MAGRNCGEVTAGNLTRSGCALVALLLLAAALSPPTAVAQRTPQPVFTELFTYDPAAPSQLLGKWLISSQLDTKLQPLRVGVVEDSSGVPVGRVTVQEGDGLEGASEAMLQARHYICDSEGSRAADVEAEPGGIVPSERAEIQVRSDRATGAGELVKFDELVWYRFSFKIAGDWPQDVPAAGRQPCRTVIHQIKQDSFKGGKSCNASPFFKIEARPARRSRALLRAGGRRHTLCPAAHGDACADLPVRPPAGEVDHGAGAPQYRAWRQWPRRHLAQRRVLRRLSGTHGRSRLWRSPQRRALHQRTAALRHLPRLARGDPDDLFRQDHVLERGPGGKPGLEHESAARLTADAAPTSAGIDADTGSPAGAARCDARARDEAVHRGLSPILTPAALIDLAKLSKVG